MAKLQPWHEEAQDYIEYAILGSFLSVGLAVLAIFSEFYVEILIGLCAIAGVGGVGVLIGSIIGFIYLIAWILEETGAIDESYIDTTLNVVFKEWYESFGAVEWIRIPIIYMEYLVTVYLGTDEFNPHDQRFKDLFMLLATPWLWHFMMIMAPLIVIIHPVVIIIYLSDPTLFAHEVYIWEHDMQIDEEDKWISFMIRNNDKFASEVDKHNVVHEGKRKKRLIRVSKHGFPQIVAKLS